ncbi:MAG: DUF3108 domain-containing protein [Comamonadaceae bacterium]|nr:DUF3108 domain-containing protein [Comamonadaceae bacterium]
MFSSPVFSMAFSSSRRGAGAALVAALALGGAPLALAKTPSAPAPAAAAAQKTAAPMPVPAAAELEYEVSGKVSGFGYSATGKLYWQHDGHSYQAEQRIRAPIVGTRWQKSEGRIGTAFLQPLRFEDSSRKRRNMRFDLAAGTVTAVESGQTQPVRQGGQDRLSLYFQLAAAMAGDAALRQPGKRLPIWTVATNKQELWEFEVVSLAPVTLPAGQMPAIELRRLQRNAQDDQKAHIWLSPQTGYLPVRIHFEDDGDAVDLRLARYTPRPGR